MGKLLGKEFSDRWLPDMYDMVIESGHSHKSRMGPTRELVNVSVTFDPNVFPYRPGMARKLGYVEALQVLSGYFDERHLSAAAPGLRYPYGPTHAYGTKIFQQLPRVIEQLADNPDSRRAILHIGKPEDGQEREKPCMQSIQFQVRGPFLVTTVYARSWDVVSGLPYDVCVMNMLAQVVAGMIGRVPYGVTFFAGSLHVYTDIWREITAGLGDRMLNKSCPFRTNFRVLPYFDNLNGYREWAIDQLNSMDTWVSGIPGGIIND